MLGFPNTGSEKGIVVIIIRCTAKVLKELGTPKSKIADYSGQLVPLQEWYANLFYWNRKKCLIFTNSDSLFSFVVMNVNRKDIKNILKLFRKGLSKSLFYENFDTEKIKHVMSLLDDVTIAKTNNRSVLGSMNEMVFQYETYLNMHEDEGEERLILAGHKINETPMSGVKEEGFNFGIPINCLKEILKK